MSGKSGHDGHQIVRYGLAGIRLAVGSTALPAPPLFARRLNVALSLLTRKSGR
jgi:hypothetical protein